MITITDRRGAKIEGWDILNDAYAQIITDHNSDSGWVPSDTVSGWEYQEAAGRTAAEQTVGGNEVTHALLAMILEAAPEDDPIFEQIEEAAGRALQAFAEEMDHEAEQQGLA